MPRRPFARAPTTNSATPHASSPAAPTSDLFSDDVLHLRRQWKWAAFSQFFFTFAALFNMSDVTIVDIEDDLTRSTSLVLPRIMQRLLYTLTQDRKVNLDNWQTALRKQYIKRDPEANPMGPEPSWTPAPESSPAPGASEEVKAEFTHDDEGDTPMVSTTHPTPAPEEIKEEHVEEDTEGTSAEATTSQRAQGEVNTPAPVESLAGSSSGSPPPQEESKNWLDLPMLVKLDSMHLLTEWQFQNSQRLRTIMKNDDETALWRIEPIGYDAKSNAYWLIGADRLWIQRPLPKRPQNRKRKRTATGDPTGRKGKRTSSEPATKRDKKHVDDSNHDVVTPKSNRTPGRSARRGASQQGGTVSAGRGGGRAAKTQAKMKMDKQARDLVEFQRQAAAAEKTKGKSAAQAPPPPRGTRLSKRLRGSTEEDDWQPVPDEWLAEGKTPAPANALPKTGLESDDESALTSLSDEEDEEDEIVDGVEHEEASNNQPGTGGEEILDDRGLEVPPEMPSDFVEWETIAVTLYEWEHVAERFEKATHYTEKALYKVLTVDIVPIITAELKEIIRQRQLEEALVHRKRSSRIAIKESEKEEAELAAKKQAEDNEKMSRARRLEARQRKEEAEREKRENAREQRRREREQRELEAQQGSKRRRDASAEIDVIGDAPPSKKPYTNGVYFHQPRQVNGSTSASGSGTRTPAGEDWELDCEICYRRGINQDDGQPMMSCGICNKWQHIPCHDSADLRAGRRRRDWDIEEFICQRCRSRGSQKYDGANQPRQYQTLGSGRSQQPHAADRATYIQPTANFSAPRAHPGYAGVQPYAASTPNGQNGHDNFRTSTSTSMTQQRPYQPSAITFAHYQPDPAGFSTRQIYQRDLPSNSNSQAYQQQASYAGRSSQPLQPEAVTNFSPIQSPPSYSNGAWNSGQQNYAPYSPGAGFAAGVSHSQDLNPPYAGIPQWQPSLQAADPRGQTSNHYQQYQQANPVIGSTSYQLPR